MPARTSQRLVIDASVAQASGGEDATYPRSKNCRDFLKAALEICHCVVMTPEIRDEWKEHQSGFARRWRVSMEARKKVMRVDVAPNEELCGRIEYSVAGEARCAEVRKDLCLIEAALATDGIVISLDDAVRALFAEAAQRVGELRGIVWVNPDRQDEQPISWLEAGARPERGRQLGTGEGGR